MRKDILTERIGQTLIMTNGQRATIIAYRSSNDIDIKFEDGTIVTNKQYTAFKRGFIKNPNLEEQKPIGEKRLMNNGQYAEIIGYKNNRNIDIKFEDGVIKKGVDYNAFKRGGINNPYYKNIFNVACLGNSATKDIEGKKKKSYECWSNMITRCYCEKYQETHPTYKDCFVCEEWLCFENFEKWFNENYYEMDNQRVMLDKDILIEGNRIYSPDTCLFVPEKINCIFKNNRGCRKSEETKNLPQGVVWNKRKQKYASQITINGEPVFLGYYSDIKDAERVYLKARSEEIKRLAEEYKYKISKKLYDRLIEISNKERG